MYKMVFGLLSFVILFSFFSCSLVKQIYHTETENTLIGPKTEREFRAAWVATVANINWPSKPGLGSDKQKQEAIKLLNILQKKNFNAVIFQVRPQCDALYQSKLEPWSYYLSGLQGKAPEPYYDPLEFWIQEAHKRGLELHVWLNPYRAHHISGGPVSDSSIVKKYPELVVRLKTGYWWMDPSQQGTQEHSLAVAMDIVQRYDIDGVHMDDYFYPYPSYNKNEDFPDEKSWEAYQQSGGTLSRGDWRRENVNNFIRRLYSSIKEIKPYVKFGLSPFGIWRPNHPESIRGFDQYDQLYADAKLWLNEGWVDYWTPQLYWPVNQIAQSYPVLLGWWAGENSKKRHLWPGISIGRQEGEKGADETINQIMITRGMLPRSPGNVHWSIGPLITNGDIGEGLLMGPYKNQALVPQSPWLDNIKPAPPQVIHHIQQDNMVISWRHPEAEDVFRWIIYYKYANNWVYKILNKQDRSLTVPVFFEQSPKSQRKKKGNAKNIRGTLIPLSEIAVSAVDRVGNESLPTIIATLNREDEKSKQPGRSLSGFVISEDPSPLPKTGLPESMEDLKSRPFYLIKCDDMGMNHSVNMAIKEVIESGFPVSTSVMFACPWYQEAVEILKQYPEVGVGIHLTLNAEWKNYRWGPVLGKETVPTLVDSMGYFFHSGTQLFAKKPKIKEIENELRAQIKRALKSGLRIDYLDYHMGTAVQTKELRKLIENLAKEFGLGMSGYFGENYSTITYDAELGDKTDSLLNHVRNLHQGLNMQVVHVGFDDPEMQALKDLNTFGKKNVSQHRREELRSILSPELVKILKEKYITLITYKELIARVGLESMKRPEKEDY